MVDALLYVSIRWRSTRNTVFRKGIRDFIDALEMALEDIKLMVFTPLNVTFEDDVQTDVAIDLIMNAMNLQDRYQRWRSELLLDSCDQCGSTLLDALAGDLEGYPMKEILAASLLWDLEALISYIEPVLIGIEHIHRMLLSLRNRIRDNTLQLILKESWCSSVHCDPADPACTCRPM